MAVDIAENPSDVHVIHVIPQLNVAEAGVIWLEIDDTTRRQHATEAFRKHYQTSSTCRSRLTSRLATRVTVCLITQKNRC